MNRRDAISAPTYYKNFSLTFEKSFPSPNVWAYFRSIHLVGASLQEKSPKLCFRGHNFHTRTQNACFPRRSSPPIYVFLGNIFIYPPTCVFPRRRSHTVFFFARFPARKQNWGKMRQEKKILFARPSQKCVSRASKYAFMFHFSAQKHAERAKKINRRFSPISPRMLSLKERITRQAGP